MTLQCHQVYNMSFFCSLAASRTYGDLGGLSVHLNLETRVIWMWETLPMEILYRSLEINIVTCSKRNQKISTTYEYMNCMICWIRKKLEVFFWCYLYQILFCVRKFWSIYVMCNRRVIINVCYFCVKLWCGTSNVN